MQHYFISFPGKESAQEIVFPEWEIDRKSLQVKDFLGEGEFGEVRQGEYFQLVGSCYMKDLNILLHFQQLKEHIVLFSFYVSKSKNNKEKITDKET